MTPALEQADEHMMNARVCDDAKIVHEVAFAVDCILAHFRNEVKPEQTPPLTPEQEAKADAIREQYEFQMGERSPTLAKITDKWGRKNLYHIENSFLGFSPSKQQDIHAVVYKLRPWASAAQDDPGCDPKLKALLLELLELAEPLPIDSSRLTTNTRATFDPVAGTHGDDPGLPGEPGPAGEPDFCPYRAKKSGMEPWPENWPAYYHRNEPCDMKIGPCSCGSWHVEGEFTVQKDSMGRLYIKREIKKWPGDHTGDGYSSQCDCSECKSIRVSVAMRDR